MNSVHPTRHLSIGQALEVYAEHMDASCCTTYVIIKEATGIDKFGVVPKISCCCSRAIKLCCGSANYYSVAQADKTVIAQQIKTFSEIEDMHFSDRFLSAIALLTPKFGTAANIFNTQTLSAARQIRETAVQHINLAVHDLHIDPRLTPATLNERSHPQYMDGVVVGNEPGALPGQTFTSLAEPTR